MPENTVKVCRPGRFGNPFKVGAEQFVAGGPPRIMTAETAVKRFEFWVTKDLGAHEIRQWLPTLKGKNLACWCKLGEPCHADVLIRLANS